MWLGFIGFTNIASIVVEPTLSDPSEVEKTQNKALDQASAIAGTSDSTPDYVNPTCGMHRPWIIVPYSLL